MTTTYHRRSKATRFERWLQRHASHAQVVKIVADAFFSFICALSTGIAIAEHKGLSALWYALFAVLFCVSLVCNVIAYVEMKGTP